MIGTGRILLAAPTQIRNPIGRSRLSSCACTLGRRAHGKEPVLQAGFSCGHPGSICSASRRRALRDTWRRRSAAFPDDQGVSANQTSTRLAVKISRIPGGSQQSPSLDSGRIVGRCERLEAAMTDHHYALFDTEIGTCAIAWGPRGINGVQLPMGDEDKTRIRMQQRFGDIAEAEPPADVIG